MALSKYSLSNLSNSAGEVLGATVLAAGYLIFWAPIDALQTADGVYTDFTLNQATILADTAVAARLAASRGILTIRDGDFSNPQFPTRPILDGTLVVPETTPVPSITLDVEHGINGGLTGLGTKERERAASLYLYGLGSSASEQRWLLERVREAFDECVLIPILDHDAGTRAPIGLAEITSSIPGTATFPLQADSLVYEFTVNARLRYEA